MRLIDADELLTHIEDYGEGQSRLDLIDPYYVRNAPTVYASKAEDCISRNLAIQRMKQNVEVVEKDVADLRKYGCEFTNEQFEKKLIERCIWTLRAIPSVYPEADMVAMLTELQWEIAEMKSYESSDGQDLVMLADIGILFQQKINELEEIKDEKK